jgi:chloramphenicol-sensitive protein RarD
MRQKTPGIGRAAEPDQEKGAMAAGTWLVVGSYLLWGVLPIYWKLLKSVHSDEILVNRILWTCLFVNLIVALDPAKRAEALGILKTPKQLLTLVASAGLIAVNWFVYIVAVNAGHIVETSLGYYINPLLTIVIGFVLLREKADRWMVVSICLAAAGVAVSTISFGRVPWIALALAFSFGFYGYVKKRLPVSGVVSLGIETAILTPFALAFIAVKGSAGGLAFGVQGPVVTGLLVFSGIVTAVPLVFFAEGARRIPLSRIGFIQYINPSIALLLGIFMYGESFSPTSVASFTLIWAAIAVYAATRGKKQAA